MAGEQKVEEVVMDFEQAAWLGLREVFPEIDIKGCIFHLCQSIYRKVQKVGLSVMYKNEPEVRNLIKQLFTLPLLPLREMINHFEMLKYQFDASHDRMKDLYNYVALTWFESSVWKPRDICAYKRLVRTNNDAEGYHRRLNSRLGEKPPIYRLVEQLFKHEAKIVNLTCRLITCKNVTMIRRRQTREKQSQLTDLWNKFDDGLIDTQEFITEAMVYSPF